MPKPPASNKLEGTVEPRSRAEWRAWLEVHHAQSAGVQLIYTKKSTGRQTLSYSDAVEEALCFGWIDSRVNSIDSERYMQVFTPRKAGSVWSKLNKGRIERLIASGLMTAAGLAKVEAARRDGSWSSLDQIEEMQIPPDLARAFRTNRAAKQAFDASGISARKIMLNSLANAKRPETRARRIAELLTRLPGR